MCVPAADRGRAGRPSSPATAASGEVHRPGVPVILSVMAEETDSGNKDYGEFVPNSDGEYRPSVLQIGS